MKTTFDLPDPLVRKAKAVAADQGRPLRDFVADAIREKLAATLDAEPRRPSRNREWNEFAATLQQLPDGFWFNPNGVQDDGFFRSLESIRVERQDWQPESLFPPAVEEPHPDTGRARRKPATPKRR